VPYVVARGINAMPGWAPFWQRILDHWLPAYRGEREPREALVSIFEMVGSGAGAPSPGDWPPGLPANGGSKGGRAWTSTTSRS
jgi:hypothetical protein